MRTYDEFKEALMENVKQRLGDAVEIVIHTVNKNNVQEEQISVRFPEDAISPSVNLENLYADYQKDEDMASAVDRLVSYLRHVPQDFEMPMLTEEEARENLFFQLISKEKNEGLLQDCPFREFYETDLVQVLRWKCGEGASFLVKHGLADQLGVTEEQLFEMADENLAQQDFRFRPMNEVLAELMGIDPDEIPAPNPKLYVLTNETGEYGAAILTKQGVRQQVRVKLDSPYFIIPSSIHELLIVPDNGEVDEKELGQMVYEINRTELAPQDVLSDHVYHFELRQGVKKVI